MDGFDRFVFFVLIPASTLAIFCLIALLSAEKARTWPAPSVVRARRLARVVAKSGPLPQPDQEYKTDDMQQGFQRDRKDIAPSPYSDRQKTDKTQRPLTDRGCGRGWWVGSHLAKRPQRQSPPHAGRSANTALARF